MLPIKSGYINTKLLHLILIFLLTTPAHASTAFVKGSRCTIHGDPDVYGIGVRLGFYLQWGASLIFLAFSPEEASVTRGSMALITSALYINTFRSVASGNLIAIEWQVLWLMTFCLNMCNWPASKAGMKKHGATIGIMLLLWAMFYLASPWMYFKGMDIGKRRGCDVRVYVFAPISVYSRGFKIAFKVLSVANAIILPPMALVGFGFAIVKWIQGWHDDEVQNHFEEPNIRSVVFAFLQTVTGAIGIGFLEKTLKLNNVSFPDTKISNSGQLIPLLLGIFTLVASIFSAIRTAQR